jgi:hypothetical protein
MDGAAGGEIQRKVASEMLASVPLLAKPGYPPHDVTRASLAERKGA